MSTDRVPDEHAEQAKQGPSAVPWHVVLPVLMGLVVLVGVVSVWNLPRLMQPRATVAAGTVATIGALFAASVGWAQAHATRREAKEQAEQQLLEQRTQFAATQEAAGVRDLRDRYTTAAEQLGHDSAAIRLAGVYALAALADDWLRRAVAVPETGRADPDAQACLDVLCAYLRMPPRVKPDNEWADPANPDYTTDVDPDDAQVRTTVTTVIADHLRTPDARTGWCGLDVNLTGAHLTNADFNQATFGGTARFDGARFTGDARFDGTTFTRTVSFRGARFTGIAWLKEAIFARDARFDDATFTRDAWFTCATFARTVWFTEAAFMREAWFSRVSFTRDALFMGTNFNGNSWFDHATFSRPPDFARAAIGSHQVSLGDHVEVTGSPVTDVATFLGLNHTPADDES